MEMTGRMRQRDSKSREKSGILSPSLERVSSKDELEHEGKGLHYSLYTGQTSVGKNAVPFILFLYFQLV